MAISWTQLGPFFDGFRPSITQSFVACRKGSSEYSVEAQNATDPDAGSQTLVEDVEQSYSPIVRTTLLSGRVLFDESLPCYLTILSYFGNVVTSPFGTICTTL
jgi:hypothetical protein